MIIRNFKSLQKSSRARRLVLEIVEAGLEAIITERVFKDNVHYSKGILRIKSKRFNLNDFRNVYVIGFGKASSEMAFELERLIHDKIKAGIVIDTKKNNKPLLKKIKVLTGTHPLPSKRNIQHTKRIVKLVSGLGKNDLVICLVSGGGSALFYYPTIPFTDSRKIFSMLLKCGANIHEINTVRKHLSMVKGGNLAKLCYPAKLLTLIFSDVIGDELSSIASGPTVIDKTTIKDCLRICKKYDIPVPRFEETPKQKRIFKSVHNVLLLNNIVAVNAMKRKALSLGLKPTIYSVKLQGEAKNVGKKLVKNVKNKSRNVAVIAAGETTVTVTGNGKGGRNQELVLGSLEELKKLEHACIASVGTDGIDNTDAAGAIADSKSLDIAASKGIDYRQYLANNDSYHFFKKMKDLIITGPTGTNVADIVVVVRT